MKRFALVLAAAAVGCAATPVASQAADYAVETGVKGVIDLYDLSSVAPTARGFSIDEVVAANHLPQIFGPVAYRVSREQYDCTSGTYDITVLKEYRRDGALLNTLHTPPNGAMRVIPATASGEMVNRFCPREGAAHVSGVAGLAPVGYVKEANTFDAYRYGQGLLDRGATR